MAVTFNTNVSALTAQRYLGSAGDATASSLAKLSSGSRVPTAKDDAAGLAIGTKLKAEVAGLKQASNNSAQAISLLQIADGALSTVSDILQRQKSLAVQASSGQLSSADRSLLNQEFQNLISEVDRIANITNFNGTSLLSGGTSVSATKNALAAFDATNDTSATSLLGNGFEDISFSNAFGDGAIKIAYNNTGTQAGDLTVTDLVRNVSQTISVATGAISAGNTETLSFGDLGVTIKLNSQFDKTTDLAGANTAKINANVTSIEVTTPSASLGLTGPTASTAAITALSFTGTGANEIFAEDLYGATAALSGAHTAVVTGNITVGTHTFVSTTAAQTYATAGTFNHTYDDGQGNTFTLSITTTGNATAGTAAGNITIDSAATQGTAGKIESTGTGVNAPNVTSVVQDTTNPFNFGNVDSAELEIDGTTASAASATITLNGTAFSTANGGGATADLSSAGIKTLTLADADGNAFSVQFNVTQAFNNGDDAQITLGQFGQLVGSSSAVSNSTTFSFKVGTGVTANDNVGFTLTATTTAQLGLTGAVISGTDGSNADSAITSVNAAINTVASRRADIGAAQSRLQFASDSIAVAIENTTGAQSAILDVDVSDEITTFTSKQVLLQAGVSLLAQANQQPALLLRLLQ